MNKEIRIEKGKETPEVFLGIEEGILEIKGRSFPTGEFYSPIIEAIDEITSDEILIKLQFEYINTSTARSLITLLEKVRKTNKKSKVIWIYEEGDLDLYEMGEDLESISKLPFEFKEILE